MTEKKTQENTHVQEDKNDKENQSDSPTTNYGPVGGVEDPEQRFMDETAEDEKEDAKKKEKLLEDISGDDVKVRTSDEIRKNQESSDNDGRKTAVELTNRGLRNDTRPGGGDGNGKTYKDERIVPSDTNAPDAGLLPDGTRVAV